MIDKPQESSVVVPPKPTDTTESGELERPPVFARKIECVGGSDVTDRRVAGRAGRQAEERRQSR